MFEPFSEAFFERFEGADVTRADDAVTPVSSISISVCRDENLDLVVELESDVARGARPTIRQDPVGTVFQPDGRIECVARYGGFGVVVGAHERSMRWDSKKSVQTFGAQSVEWNYGRKARPRYLVEWIRNVPDYGWPDSAEARYDRKLRRTLKSGSVILKMSDSRYSLSGSGSLFLEVGGHKLFLARPVDHKARPRDEAQIVYLGTPDQVVRDKIRDCLSFVLSSPIVFLGHGEYDYRWVPTSARSVRGYTADGALLGASGALPFPITRGHTQLIDQPSVQDAVMALFDAYDALDFRRLSWAYWHAVIAPLHSRAVHFGAVIEQLQRSVSLPASSRTLLPRSQWKDVLAAARSALKTTSIPHETLAILEGKLSGVNGAPSTLMIKRYLEHFGAEIGDTEIKAWKDRNKAAHGAHGSSTVDLILNSKVLQVLFHRMVACATSCSSTYVDSYNLHHPIRSIRRAIPPRV